MNYTKGEWKLNDVSFRRDYREFVVNADLRTTAESQGDSPEEAVANVHLIAAAPDMREALKDITELAPRDKLRMPYAIAAVEIADKALAKAEGRLA